MYFLRNYNCEQKNITNELLGIDIRIDTYICIHWLNPLLHKCDRRLHFNVF